MPEDQTRPQESVPDPKPSPDDPLHTATGAPTNAAHADVGDGTLVGSVPAGLTPDEMTEIANQDQAVESGTG